MKNWLKQGISIALVYQTLLLAVVGHFLFANQTSVNFPLLQRLWGAWDGDHYIFLSSHGYVTEGDPANFIVFYPLFPLLIRLVTFFLGNAYGAAFLVTNICSILGHAVLYVVFRQLKFSFWRSFRILLLFFLNPMTVYFQHVYTESLFLLVTVLGLSFSLSDRYLLSALSFGFSSATRLMGITSVVLGAWDAFRIHAKKIRIRWKLFLPLCIIPIGFTVYLLINWTVFGSPWHYQTILKDHWSKSISSPLLQYQSYGRGFLQFSPPDMVTYHLDIMSTLMFPLIVLLYLLLFFRSKQKEIPFSWIIWAVASWLVIAAQSYWLSNLRYIFLIIPLYPMLERVTWIYKPVFVALLLISAWTAFYGINLFTKGAWLY